MKTIYVTVGSIALMLTASLCSIAQTVNLTLKWQTTAQVRAIEFSPGDNTLVTGGATGNCGQYQCGQIKVWNSSNGSLVRTIAPYNMGLTNDVDVSANGNTIISGNGTGYCYPNGGCVADKPGQFKFAFTGALQQSISNPGGNVYAISYSPGDSFIAAGTGYNFTGEIRIYSNNFTLIRTLAGHDQEVDGLAFTPDGKYLVSGGDDGYVRVWDYKTGSQVRAMYHGDYLNGGSYVTVAVSPDGKYIASGGQGYNMTTKVWRVSDGALIRTLAISGSDGYNTVKFTPDSKYVVSGLTQYNSGWFGRILFWNIATGTLAKQLVDNTGKPQSGGIRDIEFSSLAKNYLAYSVSNQLKLYSLVNTSSSAALAAAATARIAAAPIETAAFPNPLTSTTTISYTLEEDGFVNLVVYDNMGRQVAVLVKEHEEAGSHTAVFDAADLPRGMYFYRLSTNQNLATGKLILE